MKIFATTLTWRYKALGLSGSWIENCTRCGGGKRRRQQDRSERVRVLESASNRWRQVANGGWRPDDSWGCSGNVDRSPLAPFLPFRRPSLPGWVTFHTHTCTPVHAFLHLRKHEKTVSFHRVLFIERTPLRTRSLLCGSSTPGDPEIRINFLEYPWNIVLACIKLTAGSTDLLINITKRGIIGKCGKIHSQIWMR